MPRTPQQLAPDSHPTDRSHLPKGSVDRVILLVTMTELVIGSPPSSPPDSGWPTSPIIRGVNGLRVGHRLTSAAVSNSFMSIYVLDLGYENLLLPLVHFGALVY